MNDSIQRKALSPHGWLSGLGVLASLAMAHGPAHALQLVDDADVSLRWDNTVKGSLKYRTQDANPALTQSYRPLAPGVQFPQALNFNAGDQNFQDRGIVSERLDLLTEVDFLWKRQYGVRVSATGWYDAKLHGSTQAPNDPFNSQRPYNEFPDGTRRLAGQKTEFLDALVFGTWRLGGSNLSVRLGQHALQYGESLFFGDNGIARAQGPIDIDKLLSAPNAQFKEIIRPVPQLSMQLQATANVTIGAYAQFRWEEDRLPPAGSYFSTANVGWGSLQPQFFAAGPNNYLLSAAPSQKPRNGGQYGMQVKWRIDETDLGFYAARYHDKNGQLYGQLNTGTSVVPGVLPGNYYYRFMEGIRTYGMSASRTLGDFNVAAEASIRDNQPLRNSQMFYGFFPGQQPPTAGTGRTAHFNISTLATFGPSFLSRESVLLAELAWNRLLKRNDPQNELDPGRTRDATAIQVLFTPTYRQVLPALDLSVPIGVRYTVDGSSSVTAWDSRGNGSATLGLEGNYLNTYNIGLNYTRYIGSATPFLDYSPLLTGGSRPIFGQGNALADRSYLSLYLRTSF